MADYDGGAAATLPSNFNIFTHSLKQEFTSIYDGVRQSLPSISFDDLSDGSEDSQGEVEPILFSQIDHEKTMQAVSELTRPVSRDQGRQVVSDEPKITSQITDLSDKQDASSSGLLNSASDMVKASMQRLPPPSSVGRAGSSATIRHRAPLIATGPEWKSIPNYSQMARR
jgi:hypothetical protein